ncbi:MAG: hypothetical protein ASARMPRED_001138 [Alectoria sarmentosa]|nr:MAG: hypothetical protein ASARMPRED_001138 [Alectoria sarmentosa]
MADIRSLLRNERAQRRINHPQASYSATGTLGCSVCHIPLKSDVEVWDKHLKSTQHAMRQERLRLSTSQRPKSTNLPEKAGEVSSREVSAGSKKRKASEGDDESRKRTRPVVEMPGEFFDEIIEANNGSRPQEPERESADEATKPLQGFVRATDAAPNAGPVSTLPKSSSQIATVKNSNPIDEDEWAAFERDVATPPPDSSVASAFTAAATISAAPVTAAELAAQSREQASLQGRERREVEVEGEKEDAARALEEEFDEMEGLEEREVDERPENDGEKDVEGKSTGGVQEDEQSEDEDDDDGWGAWGS